MIKYKLAREEINRRAKGLLIWFQVLAAVILLVVSLSASQVSAHLWVSAVVVYALITLYLGYVYLYYKKHQVSICVSDGRLRIPVFYFPMFTRNICLDSISSIEELSIKNHFLLTIGRAYKRPVALESVMFELDDEFSSLHNLIKERAGKNISKEALEVKSHIASLQKKTLNLCTLIVSLFLVVCFLVFSLFVDNDLSETDLIMAGASTKNMMEDKELYRLFSSFFIHFNVIHLLLNVLAFAILGAMLENLLGWVRFINVILLSSLAGVFLSHYLSGFSASIGSSGGVFGLLGAYAVLSIKCEKLLPASVHRIPVWELAIVLLAEIILTYSSAAIDGFNHFGGFVFGAIYACFIVFKPRLSGFMATTSCEKLVSLVLILSYIEGVGYFVCVVL